MGRRLHERGAAASVTPEVERTRVTVPCDAEMVEVLACVGAELGVAPSQELSFRGVPLQIRDTVSGVRHPPVTVMDLGMEDGAVLRLGGEHSQDLLHQVVAGVRTALRTRTAALEREEKVKAKVISFNSVKRLVLVRGDVIVGPCLVLKRVMLARERERRTAATRKAVGRWRAGAIGKSGGLGGKRQGDESTPGCTVGCMIM